MVLCTKVRLLCLSVIVLISSVPSNGEKPAETAVAAVEALKKALTDANTEAGKIQVPADAIHSTTQNGKAQANVLKEEVKLAVAAVLAAKNNAGSIVVDKSSITSVDSTVSIELAVIKSAQAKWAMDAVVVALKAAKLKVDSAVKTTQVPAFESPFDTAKLSMDIAKFVADGTKVAADKAAGKTGSDISTKEAAIDAVKGLKAALKAAKTEAGKIQTTADGIVTAANTQGKAEAEALKKAVETAVSAVGEAQGKANSISEDMTKVTTAAFNTSIEEAVKKSEKAKSAMEAVVVALKAAKEKVTTAVKTNNIVPFENGVWKTAKESMDIAKLVMDGTKDAAYKAADKTGSCSGSGSGVIGVQLPLIVLATISTFLYSKSL